MNKENGDKLQLQILDDKRLHVLAGICGSGLAENFYLAGGTALSLQLGLRESYDFEFFTGDDFNENVILSEIRELFPNAVRILRLNTGTCDMLIEGIQVRFLQYPYNSVADFVQTLEIEGLVLASVYDIAVMKFSAIGGRGSKKDFFDLYNIYKNVQDYNSDRLIKDTIRKFGEDRDLTYMIMGLSYFDDAESEELPTCYVDYDWNKIKEFFLIEQSNIFSMMLHEIND